LAEQVLTKNCRLLRRKNGSCRSERRLPTSAS
jgi:hypothetical protein